MNMDTKFKVPPGIVELVLTAESPIAHGDPAVQRDTNIMSFNRQKQILPLDRAFSDSDDGEFLRAISAHHPCTAGLKKLFVQSSTAEVVAVIITRLFIEIYNGQGLMTGSERYSMLDGRIKAAAMKAGSLSSFWATLLDSVKVSIQPSSYDPLLAELFSLSQKLQALALSMLIECGNVCVFKARLWNDALKKARKGEGDTPGENVDPQRLIEDPDVNAGGGKEESLDFNQALDLLAMLSNPVDTQRTQAQSSIIEVPTVSANTIRNRLVRAPGWEHLCAALGIDAEHPGDGELPLGVEALFVNGGNIESGAKQPNNPEAMANAVRRKYPLLDLLGGVMNATILGRSCLSVNSWLVCRENAAILDKTSVSDSPNMKISSFQMVDSETKVRSKTLRGVGQQIANAETLAVGSEIFVRLTLTPFTTDLTKGALYAALRTFESSPYVGGRSATGNGMMDMRILKDLEGAGDLLGLYEDYLEEHRDQLRDGLLRGTFCIGDKAICS